MTPTKEAWTWLFALLGFVLSLQQDNLPLLAGIW